MYTRPLIIAGAFLLAAIAAWSTDIDNLVKSTGAPARFADHVANFSVSDEEFTFKEYSGPQKRTYSVIKDGDKYVAVYDKDEPKLDMITFDPEKTSAIINMPNRYNWTTLLGTRLSTCIWYDGFSSSGDVKKNTFSGGGKTITLTCSEQWTRKPKMDKDGKPVLKADGTPETTGRNATSDYVFTLRCDPILGYVWDISTRLVTDDTSKKTPEMFNVQPGRLADPWPDKWNYDRTLFTPAGSDKIKGWWNNLKAADISDNNGVQNFVIRDGGFVGFFTNKNDEGWGVALEHTSFNRVKAYNATCNYWEDQHNIVAMPAPDANGKMTVDLRWRFLGTPPEITKAILDKTEVMDFGKANQVMVRLGMLEDFEAQPLPLTSNYRALWSWGAAVTEAKAHSGKKSFVVAGKDLKAKLEEYEAKFVGPFIFLEPNSTYHLECWILVEPDTKASDKARIDSEGFISIQGPVSMDPKKIGKTQTEHIKADGEWHKVSLDIVTADPGGSADIRFLCHGNGTAYFDDFSFMKVK
ncbi:MAG: hypothetical protein WCJ56_01360 [bacterium]